MRFFTETADARARRLLACGCSAVALSIASSPAMAQDGEAPVASTAASAGDDSSDRPAILVTGSRLITNGMNAPVPITSLSVDELEAMDPGSLISSVSQLPQFYGNSTPNNSNFFVRGGTGNLNLRGLGANRTLTLLDGRRVPATSAFGGVDINLFPEAMIRGIETVTGGASAQYGTDAVAGVVNFLLDTDFTGLQADLQGGITERGDAKSYEAKFAWGTNIGDRGHFLVSGARAEADGVHDLTSRDWYTSTGAVQVNGVWTDFPDVHTSAASFDGIISAPGTVIDRLAFDRNGNFSPFVNGTITGPGRTVGGDGDDLNSEVFTLYPDTERYSLFAYGDYELSDNFTVFAQYMHGYNRQFQWNFPRASLQGVPTGITIFQDNAFLPASLRQIMIDNNIQSFNLRRMGSIEDIGDVWFEDRTTQNVGTVGFSYDIDSGGFMNGWQIDAYYQYGHSKRKWDQHTLRIDRIFAAVDAVDDGNGNIVCRVTTVAAGAAAFPGCQPLNLFGRGNASEGAIDYVLGNDPGVQINTPLYFANIGYTGENYNYTTIDPKRNITTFKQHFAEIAARGELFDLWAGPVSLAVGFSYRDESIYQIVQDQGNQESNHDGAYHPCSLATGPALGLRGLSPPDCGNTVAHQFSKVSNIQGAADVKEAFAETLIPLVDDDNGFALNLNLAGRWADYSGSGTIWAYKGGVDLSVSRALRFRGTYSRDVRAGNLSERFDKTGGAGNVLDPRITAADTAACEAATFVGNADCGNTYQVTIFSGGNPLINPEEADTYTAGVVFTPGFLPGFSASVDWYKVNIEGAIATVGTNEVARRCLEDAEQLFCDLITYSGTTTAGNYPKMILVGNQFVNVAASRVEGVDAEIGYRTSIDLFGGGDEFLSARAFMTWLLDRSDIGATGTVTRFDGLTGIAPDSGAQGQFPGFKANVSVNYTNGPFTLNLQGRVIGSGARSYTLDPTAIADNDVPAVYYADMRMAYEFTIGNSTAEVWGAVTNMFDKDPPVNGTFSGFTGASTQYNAGLFDVLGRRYTLGLKFKM